MTDPQTASRRTTDAKRAAFLSGIARRMSHDAACAAAGISRRLPYHWRATDPDFAATWTATAEDAGHLVSQRQVAEWRDELAQQERELAELETALVEVAAPAAAGDAEAQQRQTDLRARHHKAQESVAALRTVIVSGEQHLQRQAAERAERDREAAQVEDDQLAKDQRAAAERIDAALRTIEAAWNEFDQLAKQRQSAARRAGSIARPAAARMLIAAAFACAPATAVALGLDPIYRARCRPLRDTLQ